MTALSTRQQIEQQIAELVVEKLIDEGFAVKVNDGEIDLTQYIKRPSIILEAMFGEKTATDDNVLFVRGKVDGWIKFVYGNDGWDVISDYSVSLESVLAPVNKICQDGDIKKLFVR